MPSCLTRPLVPMLGAGSWEWPKRGASWGPRAPGKHAAKPRISELITVHGEVLKDDGAWTGKLAPMTSAGGRNLCISGERGWGSVKYGGGRMGISLCLARNLEVQRFNGPPLRGVGVH